MVKSSAWRLSESVTTHRRLVLGGAIPAAIAQFIVVLDRLRQRGEHVAPMPCGEEGDVNRSDVRRGS